MTGVSFDRFVLNGRYTAAPYVLGPEAAAPSLEVHCSGGKFRSGEFHLRAVAESEPGARTMLRGAPQAHVDIRTNKKAKLSEDWWEISNNGQTLFFDKQRLESLLTGKMLGHPRDRATLIRELTLGVVESLANEVVVQFDMPLQDDQMIDACGLEPGKRRFQRITPR